MKCKEEPNLAVAFYEIGRCYYYGIGKKEMKGLPVFGLNKQSVWVLNGSLILNADTMRS